MYISPVACLFFPCTSLKQTCTRHDNYKTKSDLESDMIRLEVNLDQTCSCLKLDDQT